MVKLVVLGVCGSAAAIESPKLARELVRRGISMRCVMSASAREIIHPNIMEWATQHKVITGITGKVEHVNLCGVEGTASLLLICPATANTISKIANGIDDTPVTTFATTAIGSGIPVIIVPAMHASMYKNPFVVENLEKLKRRNIQIVEPRFEENKAKLADIEKIADIVLRTV